MVQMMDLEFDGVAGVKEQVFSLLGRAGNSTRCEELTADNPLI